MSDDCVFQTAAGTEACGTRHVGSRGRAQGLRRRLGYGARCAVDQRQALRPRRLRHLANGPSRGTAADGSRIETDGVDVFTLPATARSRPRTCFARRGPTCPPVAVAPAPADHGSRTHRPRRRAATCRPTSATTRATTRWSPPTPGSGRAYAPTYWVATRRHAAARRRPGRRATSTPTSSSSARARPASRRRWTWPQEHGVQAVGARGQPGLLGLLEPQRRPGPERERPAEALAVDRALGPRRRAARSTPRSAPASRTSRR